MAAKMVTPQPKILAAIVFGVIGIIALGNGAAVWVLTRGAGDALKERAPLILAIGIVTPLLSAAAAYAAAIFAARVWKKRQSAPIDLHETLTKCRALAASKAAEKGVVLHLYAEPAISKILLGDPDLLLRALTLLLLNAVKYTNTGMVKLHSAIKETRKNNITVSFEVKDSGVGMTGEQVKKTLEAKEYEVRDIVKEMGGKLEIESAPGLGSRFSFDLTFDTADAPAGGAHGTWSAAEAAGENNPDGFEKPVFEGEVLLCEDSAINQQIVCEHLARVGLRTVVANNGKIGVEMVEDRMLTGSKPFDLIFMDIHMPVMDGLEAASKILALNADIPMVAITANIMPNDLELYRASGLRGCVGKPFSSQELWRCLNQYFKSAAGGQTAAEDHFMRVKYRLREKMAAHFVRDNQNTIAQIRNAISAGDIKLAHRLAHTLKGGAGELDKFVLRQAALEVEQNLKDEKNRVTPWQLTALEAELNTALAELAPLAEEGMKNA